MITIERCKVKIGHVSVYWDPHFIDGKTGQAGDLKKKKAGILIEVLELTSLSLTLGCFFLCLWDVFLSDKIEPVLTGKAKVWFCSNTQG